MASLVIQFNVIKNQVFLLCNEYKEMTTLEHNYYNQCNIIQILLFWCSSTRYMGDRFITIYTHGIFVHFAKERNRE